MSRFYGRITPGNGKTVQRQGHSLHGLDLHAAGSVSGIEVQARAEGTVDVFDILATEGYRTSQSRYLTVPIGTARYVPHVGFCLHDSDVRLLWTSDRGWLL